MICHYCSYFHYPSPSATPSLFSAAVIPFPVLVTVPVSPFLFHITPVPLVIIVLSFLFLPSPFAVAVPRCHQWRGSCHPHPMVIGMVPATVVLGPRSPWFSGPGIISHFRRSCHRPCRPVLCGRGPCGSRCPLVAVVAAVSVCTVVGLVVGVGIFLPVLFVRRW
jgi:hypothetical protein